MPTDRHAPAVTILDARERAGFSEREGGRWITYCERHDEFVQHETRDLARSWRQHPAGWCDGCYAELPVPGQ